MPDVESRDLIRAFVLRQAKEDPRIVAAAVIGSSASGSDDRWSDLDFTFGVTEDAAVADVMEDWSRKLIGAFGGTHLLDLRRGELVYRVFLFPGWMQVDLSFAPCAARQLGRSFVSLFGPYEKRIEPPPSTSDAFTWGVLYARAAMVAIERGQKWHAEYCISALRDRGAYDRVPTARPTNSTREGVRPTPARRASGC